MQSLNNKTRRYKTHYTFAGFTLIELMVVIVILGILAGIVYPSYRSHVVKSNRTAAQSFMVSLSGRQEQLILDTRQYQSATNNVEVATNLGLEVPSEVARFYALSIAAVNPSGSSTLPPSYTIAATPRADTMQAGDATLTLASTGERTPEHLWK